MLGKTTDVENITDPDVKRIAQGFKKGFLIFKEDKEVKNMMTVREKWEAEARAEAREEGMEEGKAETALEMFAKGLDPKFISDCVKMPLEWVHGTLKSKMS